MSNLPWKLGADNRISNNDGLTVADCRYVANQGPRIVQAVNSFEALKEVVELLMTMLEATDTCLKTWNKVGSPVNVEHGIQVAKAALKLAGEHNAD